MVVSNAGSPKLCSASVPAFSGLAIEVPALTSCQYQPYYGRAVGSVSSLKLSVPALLWACWYLSVSAPQIVMCLPAHRRYWAFVLFVPAKLGSCSLCASSHIALCLPVVPGRAYAL